MSVCLALGTENCPIRSHVIRIFPSGNAHLEYGRGTGADCRRHVQKLNSLRGELTKCKGLWSSNANFLCLYLLPPCQDEVQVVSRWSKYVDQTGSGPEKDEEEEEDVYTERSRFRSHDKIRSVYWLCSQKA
uniref:Uncharacterized protein n=1 Tax=Pygocentrus nattereri TaxID=42514 RepID=A0AAR2IVZ7_PYGNA